MAFSLILRGTKFTPESKFLFGYAPAHLCYEGHLTFPPESQSKICLDLEKIPVSWIADPCSGNDISHKFQSINT